MPDEVAPCQVCGQPIPAKRVAEGLTTCGPTCSRRRARRRYPSTRLKSRYLRKLDGPPLWNDQALRDRLGGITREQASRRLTLLAHKHDLVVCPDERYAGGVRFVGAPRRAADRPR